MVQKNSASESICQINQKITQTDVSLPSNNSLPIANKCQDETEFISLVVSCYYRNKTSNSAKTVTLGNNKHQFLDSNQGRKKRNEKLDFKTVRINIWVLCSRISTTHEFLAFFNQNKYYSRIAYTLEIPKEHFMQRWAQ